MRLDAMPTDALADVFIASGATPERAAAVAREIKQPPARDLILVDDDGQPLPPPTAAEALDRLRRRFADDGQQ